VVVNGPVHTLLKHPIQAAYAEVIQHKPRGESQMGALTAPQVDPRPRFLTPRSRPSLS
jgi:hypothetical protein